MRAYVDELRELAAGVRADGIDRVLVCGMGGSSLCVEVLASVLGAARGLPVRVLDSTHPAAVASAAEWATPERSLYVIASKSGTTTEPNDFAAFFEARAAGALGSQAGRHFVAITDPGTVLVEHAIGFGYRSVSENPPDIGGRYSALSLFGLVPAALLGVDLDALLEQAREMALECGPDVDDADSPGVRLGRFMADNALDGRDKVTVLTAPDRAVVGIDDAGVSAPGATELKAAEHPTTFLGLGEGIELGAEFFRWEFATAVAGHLLGINAFDQPDVQAAKDATKRVLAELAAGGGLPAPAMWLRGERDIGGVAALLRDLLTGVGPGEYVALMAYLDPTAQAEATLQRARTGIRNATRAATTLGFGPRFLHSN